MDSFCNLLPDGGEILDLGCGPGEPLARGFIDQSYRVTGVDSASTMIALCQESFPAHRWINADMRGLALGERFDGVLAWNSFFHLGHDDQRAMFPIFARHAQPGAPLMFTSGPAHGEAIGTLYGEDLHHASLDPSEYRALLAENGFVEIAYLPEDPNCGGHTVWLARAADRREGEGR
jgi:SAM-dependent methyltransferase